jgi:hypothetical protein
LGYVGSIDARDRHNVGIATTSNFDDNLHEYADAYRPEIDRYIASNPVPEFR